MNDEDSIRELESQRDEVIAFLDSWIHRQYVTNTKKAIEQVKEELLAIVIRSDSDIYFQIEQRAKLELATANLTDFEDMVSNLNGRIEAILRTVQPNETQLNDNE